ncbi:MAG TPA: ABC transporter ATP-binding protein [Myxococcota bacterium]|nr:ABC transporter ATP-binding protein [Myxococcota bacterium]
MRGLRTRFVTERGVVQAVDDVSFDIATGRTLGVVGESGCGKSVTALSIMRLIPDPPGRVVGGRILYRGEDLLGLDGAAMRRIRGKKISMIFQEPMTSLNPVLRVGEQIAEAVRLHEGAGAEQALARTVEMLELVGIPSAGERVHAYPHQLSGGMRQRVMIAMALSCHPDLLIADEPTTALDVTIQAQIMDLLRRLQRELGMSIILITHDLGVVAEMAERVVVMYAGNVVEEGTVDQIFTVPAHPYTAGLLRSVPSFTNFAAAGPSAGASAGASANSGAAAAPATGAPAAATARPRLHTIPGMVPDLLKLPKGCRFQERCELVQTRCRETEPPLQPHSGGGNVRCYFPLGAPAAAGGPAA